MVDRREQIRLVLSLDAEQAMIAILSTEGIAFSSGVGVGGVTLDIYEEPEELERVLIEWAKALVKAHEAFVLSQQK